ncbi:sensor histidine kinase [Winogradskyella sp.]|uniref:sensor histidine kinase n=1 Tax=Winogradskyella sp. TaxID=1883156 RepID=UPI003AB1D9F9
MANKETIKAKETISLYWKFQWLGWSLASVYWAYVVYVKQDYTIFYTLVNFILDVSIGIFLTHSYKMSLNKLTLNPLKKSLVLQLSISILVLAVLFMLLNNLKWYAYWGLVKGGTYNFFKSLIFWDPPLITGLRLMSIWVLAYHFYQFYKKELRMTKNNAALSVIAKQVQLDHLSNQLNPHFLFNSLNSVKSLIAESPEKARRSIDLLSEILRSSIYTKEHFITLKEELQLIEDYIELEKLRFEERLHLKITVDNTLLDQKVPSLCVQSLIENGIKHGIQNSIVGGRILLSISRQAENLLIVVQSPGQLGAKFKEGKGMGIKNLKERLQLHYKEKAVFTLEEQPKGLIVATIIIPLSL